MDELILESPIEQSMHAFLIEKAAKWLARKGCSVIITDMAHGYTETPDAIGWHGTLSILIECKASVSDFRADSRKIFRRYPHEGMGGHRYYCMPRGLVAVKKLPAKWGLLEWDGKKLIETRKPDYHEEKRSEAEISLLLSSLRRVAANAPAGISVKCYTLETKNRATLGVEIEDELPSNPR